MPKHIHIKIPYLLDFICESLLILKNPVKFMLLQAFLLILVFYQSKSSEILMKNLHFSEVFMTSRLVFV